MKSSPERPQFRRWDVINFTPKEINNPETNIKLRILSERDSDFILKLASDKDVARYVPWAKYVIDEDSAAEQAWRFGEQFFGNRAARYGIQKDGQLCGYIGLWPLYEPDTYEVGCAILPEFRGQGLIGEALSMVEDELVKIGAVKIIAHVDESNSYSARALENLGFKFTDQFNEDSEQRLEKQLK